MPVDALSQNNLAAILNGDPNAIAALRAAGWTGTDQFGGAGVSRLAGDHNNQYNEITPEFQAWLSQNGYKLGGDFSGGSSLTAGVNGANGNQIANARYDDSGGLFDYLPAIGSIALAGYGAADALGAGALGGDSAALGSGQVGALDAGTAGTAGAAGTGATGSGIVAGGNGITGATLGGTAAGGVGAAGAGGSAAGAVAGTAPSWINSLLPAAGSLISSLASADAQRSASNTAADATTRAANAGIAQQQSQFDAIQKLLSPYVTTGTSALGSQADLAGINGNDKQAAAIAALQASPAFTSAQKLGENRILANASATGGLRGGNTQAALAQFNPALLASTINDQYSRLGGLSSMGQNAAAGVGNAGMATGNNVTNLLGQIGSAQAGQALAGGRSDLTAINGLSSALGQFYGNGGGQLVRGLF